MLSSITREFAALLVFYRIKGHKDGFELDYRIYIFSAHCRLFATLTTRQVYSFKTLRHCEEKSRERPVFTIYCICILNFLYFFIYQWRRGSRCCCSRPAGRRWRCSDPAAQSPPRFRYRSPARRDVNILWYNIYIYQRRIQFCTGTYILLQHRTVDIIDGSIYVHIYIHLYVCI